MFMGVVPICTNLGAHSDRIQHGINGLLVPPHDSQTVVQTLLKLHADQTSCFTPQWSPCSKPEY